MLGGGPVIWGGGGPGGGPGGIETDIAPINVRQYQDFQQSYLSLKDELIHMDSICHV